MKMQSIDALVAKMVYIVPVAFTKVPQFLLSIVLESICLKLIPLTAHTGPNAGFQEKTHKWTKYQKPKRLVSPD